MKILNVTTFKNTWISYWSTFWKDRGHECVWMVGAPKLISDEIKKAWHSEYDAVLVHWGDAWATQFSQFWKKPLYVIVRSYEHFASSRLSKLESINWKSVTHAFILNEANYPLFKRRTNYEKVTFFKNGIDFNEWKLLKREKKAKTSVLWVCDFNSKKSPPLALQAFSEMCVNRLDMEMNHIGQLQDIMSWEYFEHMAKVMKLKVTHNGYNNSHEFVKFFLSKSAYLLSSSIKEGSPMNLIEGMATGCIPLVHNWPGAEKQFPSHLIWNDMTDVRGIFDYLEDSDCETTPEWCREWAKKHYDYRENYKPVAEEIERGMQSSIRYADSSEGHPGE